jgi:hypothetical protein
MRRTHSKRIILGALLLFSIINSALVFAQSDSTNLPSLSTSALTPNNATTGSGVPDPALLDAVTTTTETEVLPCPSGYYANGPVPTDGTDVADQTVTGGVIYDQTVTTDRYGTTTYGGWVEENFLCTQIPPAPTCPTGETEVSAPYWDSTTNTWVGIVCQVPITYTTFFYPIDCVAYNDHWSGTTDALIYEENNAGVISYFQMVHSESGWNQFAVNKDSQGRYYVVALGDEWGETGSATGEPVDPLYGLGLVTNQTSWNASTAVAPGYPAPSGSPSYCTYSSGH